ncbi:hypothetical protein HKX48_000063 [Thoreauomyces humboldtii]|nr:hypothetical protein HKX48_000063 [Thoreauomyces humboldtii]
MEDTDFDSTRVEIRPEEPSKEQKTIDLERQLEEGAIFRHASMKHITQVDPVEAHARGRKASIIVYFAWMTILLASTIVSYVSADHGFAAAWLPTGVLTAALIRNNAPRTFYLLLGAIPIRFGVGAYVLGPVPGAIGAAVHVVCSAFMAALAKRICPAISNGHENLRGTIAYLLLILLGAIMEAFTFAFPVSSSARFANTGFNILVLRLFVGNVLGTLLVNPFFLAINARKAWRIIFFWKSGRLRYAMAMFVTASFMVGIPFMFLAAPPLVYGFSMYLLMPFAYVAVLNGGILGLCFSVSLGFASSIFVESYYRETPSASTDYNTGSFLQDDNVRTILGYQVWTASLIASGLLFLGVMRERDVAEVAFDRLQRGVARNGTKESTRRSNAVALAAESATLLTFVCDELQMPLQEVIRHATTIAANSGLGKTGQSAQAIKKSGAHMLAIVNDAWELANVANGTIVLEPTDVDLPRFLEQLTDEVRTGLADRELKIETKFSVPQSARLDEARVRRVFRAVVLNACKRVPQRGCIQIHATTSTRYSKPSDRRDTIELDISVTVAGFMLDDRQVDLLIRPYAHGRVTSDGTADLSMAVATVLARYMGGRVVLFTQPGRGTVFSCRLPVKVDIGSGYGDLPDMTHKKNDEPTGGALKPPLMKQISTVATHAAENIGRRLSSANLRRRSRDYAHIDIASLPDTAANTPRPLGPPPPTSPGEMSMMTTGSGTTPMDTPGDVSDKQLVLVVDDSRINRMILIKMLSSYPDLKVHEAANGTDAFVMCMSHTYSLILMDLIMGEMDGYECTRRLRREGITTPIILTTANVERTETFRHAGVDQLLIKPIRREHLADVLTTLRIVPEQTQEQPDIDPMTPPPLGTEISQILSEQLGYFDCKKPNSVSGMFPQSPSFSSASSGSLFPHLRNSGSMPRSPHVFARNAPILIVDDNDVTRRILRKQLTGLLPGREIVEATDGRQAVALCGAGQKFAIIYTDLDMPGMSGDIASARIRTMRAISGGPPIVAVTGHVLDTESYQGLRAAGINDAITKPVSTEVLADTLVTYGITTDGGSISRQASPDLASSRNSSDTAPNGFGEVRREYKAQLQRTRSLSPGSSLSRPPRSIRASDSNHDSAPATPDAGSLSRPLLYADRSERARQSASADTPEIAVTPDLNEERGRSETRRH